MAVLKRRASSLFSRRGIGTAASMRPVALSILERPHYRDIAAITAKGAPIYGVDINVLQFVVIG